MCRKINILAINKKTITKIPSEKGASFCTMKDNRKMYEYAFLVTSNKNRYCI